MGTGSTNVSRQKTPLEKFETESTGGDIFRYFHKQQRHLPCCSVKHARVDVSVHWQTCIFFLSNDPWELINESHSVQANDLISSGPRAFPILHVEPFDAFEFAGIVGHENRAMRQDDGGDQQIMRSNHLPSAGQFLTNNGVGIGGAILER